MMLMQIMIAKERLNLCNITFLHKLLIFICLSFDNFLQALLVSRWRTYQGSQNFAFMNKFCNLGGIPYLGYLSQIGGLPIFSNRKSMKTRTLAVKTFDFG